MSQSGWYFTGKWYPLRPLIGNETKNIVEHLATSVTAADLTDTIYTRWATGGDASGRHSVFRSCKTDAGPNNRNIILGGACCISIHNERNELLYEEKSLGPSSEYPHYLIPGSESVELVRKIIGKYQAEVKDVQDNHVISEILGKNVTIIPKIEFSQNDAAFLKKVTGLAGSIF